MSFLGDFGGLIGAGVDFLGGMIANDTNKDIASDNRQFQEYMSNTAYQRAVDDMRKAGLNPMLAYHNGGASTPSGSTATMTNPVSSAVSSALQYNVQRAQIEQMKAQTENAKADTAVKRATENNIGQDTMLKAVQAEKEGQGVFATTAQTENTRQRTATDVQSMVKIMAEVDRIALQNKLTREQTFLVKQQFENAFKEGRKLDFSTLSEKARSELMQLAVPRAKNEAAAEETMFKKDWSPYLKDLFMLFRMFTSGAQAHSLMTR